MDQLSPDGPVYQAGTLSGNPLAMAAGLAQLRELDRIDGWQLLEHLGSHLDECTRAALKRTGVAATFQRIGSMFCLYFIDTPVRNVDDAKRSDTTRFAQFFGQCLASSVYFAPSQFEAGFISTAHTPDLIDRTAKVVEAALQTLAG
jgi:glutamate-1-semialdehyde 2,1-aminomutase